MTDTKPKLIGVTVIKTSGMATVVEYLEKGKSKRVTVPNGEIRDGKVTAEVLAMGIHYGVPWEKELTFTATPAMFEDELHRNGIWTAADALQNPGAVEGALRAVFGIEISKIFKVAHDHQRKVK